MARRARCDQPGTWHHVTNRGIARRPVFETQEDFRYFQSRLAYAVRRRELEIHAFSVLSTHFHLLVRSPTGSLSEGMRRVQNEYVRHFNRLRRRDGPLFRGRFRSQLVDSRVYRHVLVRYIDLNAVEAGLTRMPHLYPYASANCYMRSSGPKWLQRSWIERVVVDTCGSRFYRSKDYSDIFGSYPVSGLSSLVEQRLTAGSRHPDPLDRLMEATPQEVLTWLQRKARLADGSKPGLAVCDGASITETVERNRAELGPWNLRIGKNDYDAWSQVHVSLLRDLAGFSLSQVSRTTIISVSGASKMYHRHRALLVSDNGYAERVREITMEAWRFSSLGVVSRIAGAVEEWS